MPIIASIWSCEIPAEMEVLHPLMATCLYQSLAQLQQTTLEE
jgi:hypothetical protein